MDEDEIRLEGQRQEKAIQEQRRYERAMREEQELRREMAEREAEKRYFQNSLVNDRNFFRKTKKKFF